MPGSEQHPGRVGKTKHVIDILIGLMVCIVAAPVAVVATIALRPFWAWLETTSSIESIGHSGPAEWCYLCIYLITICCAGLAWSTIRPGRQREK